MKYCNIHRTLFLGVNQCKKCYKERYEAEIQSEEEIKRMLNLFNEPLSLEQRDLINKIKQSLIEVTINQKRLLYS